MDGHSKREVYVRNIQYELEKSYCFISFLKPADNNLQFLANWSRDISRDLLTQYLYFEMLRTMSSLLAPNFDSAPSSMPKK